MIPKSVREAQLAGDHDALSRMGHRGGKNSALNRTRRLLLIDVAEMSAAIKLREFISEQEALYSTSPDGDVLPPVPDEDEE